MVPLLWCDVESSAFKPEEGNILEIALVATDEELRIEDQISYVVHHDKIRWSAHTFEFHQKHRPNISALVYESETDLLAVEYRLREWVRGRFEGRPLAGSSPHCLDRPFLEHSMPRLASLLHRHTFDVRTLYYAFDVRADTQLDRTHVAMEDVIGEIARTREILRRIK